MIQAQESKFIYWNGKPIQSFAFSGGEIQVKVEAPKMGDNTMTAYLTCPQAIMELLLAVDAVKRQDSGCRLTDLIIPYFPYARQDRVCQPGEALSVKVMADLINGLGFQAVAVFDAHSPVTTALINNCVHYDVCDMLGRENADLLMMHDFLISPDAGAEKKVAALGKQLCKEVLVATKKRDTSTGQITGTELHAERGLLTGLSVLIVDDICDGGATFVALASMLKKDHGAARVNLMVTHGIFSRGLDALRPAVDDVLYFNTLNQDPEIGWGDLIINQLPTYYQSPKRS